MSRRGQSSPGAAVADRSPGVVWTRLLPGVAMLAVVVYVLVTRWDTVTSSHPAYLVTVVATGLLAVVLVALSRQSGPRPAR